MAPRAIGAFLALAAAIMFVVSIASSAWWDGHPAVEGRTISAKHVSVGLYAATGCNTGGSCESIDRDHTFTLAGYIELGAIGLAVLLAVIMMFAAWKISDARKTIGSLSLVATLLAGAGGGALLLLGPGLETTQQVEVPIGWGMYVFGGAVGSALLGALITRKLQPEPLRLKPSAAVLPRAQAQPDFDVRDIVPPSAMVPEPFERPATTHEMFSRPITPPMIEVVDPRSADPGPVAAAVPAVVAPPVRAGSDIPLPAPASVTGPRATVPARTPDPFARTESIPALRDKPASVPPPIPRQKPPSMPPARPAPSRNDESRPRNKTLPPPSPGVTLPPRKPVVPRPIPRPSQPPPRKSQPTLAHAIPPPPAVELRMPTEVDDEQTVSVNPAELEAQSKGDVTQTSAPVDPSSTEQMAAVRPTTEQATADEPAAHRIDRAATSVEPPRDPDEQPTFNEPRNRDDNPTLRNRDDDDPRDRANAPALDQPGNRDELPAFDRAGNRDELPAFDRAGKRDEMPTLDRAGNRDELRAVDRAGNRDETPTLDDPRTGAEPSRGEHTDQTRAADTDQTRAADTDQTRAAAGDHTDQTRSPAFRHRGTPIPALDRPSQYPISTAPTSLPPPRISESMPTGPTPACPQCESPMAWVEEHLRFYCKQCRMYF